MSYEICMLMNGVLGMFSLLVSIEFIVFQSEMVDLIYYFGEVLLDILNDILDLVNIENGWFEVEQVIYNLFELV